MTRSRSAGEPRPFTGTVAVVTGASRGIGLAIARRLVADGARVCLTARNAEPLAAAVEELGGAGHALGVAGRADDPAHQQEALRATTEAFGAVDLLVNNAGINPVAGPLAEASLAVAQKVLQVNVVAALGWALTACLAEELAPTVRVNAVAPAIVRTRFAAALYQGREQQVAEGYPLRRLGAPQDVAGAVAFLASAEAAWITGQTLVIDGGMLLTGGVA